GGAGDVPPAPGGGPTHGTGAGADAGRGEHAEVRALSGAGAGGADGDGDEQERGEPPLRGEDAGATRGRAVAAVGRPRLAGATHRRHRVPPRRRTPSRT